MKQYKRTRGLHLLQKYGIFFNFSRQLSKKICLQFTQGRLTSPMLDMGTVLRQMTCPSISVELTSHLSPSIHPMVRLSAFCINLSARRSLVQICKLLFAFFFPYMDLSDIKTTILVRESMLSLYLPASSELAWSFLRTYFCAMLSLRG